MRCLTPSEIHKWLAGQGMHHQPLEGGVPDAGDYALPAEGRARLQVATYLADQLAKDGNKLVELVPGLGLQSAVNDSIRCLRQMFDEMRPTSAAPGHLFKCADRMHFRAMLAILLGSENPPVFYIYSAPSRTTLLVRDGLEVWTPKRGVKNELARHFLRRHAA